MATAAHDVQKVGIKSMRGSIHSIENLFTALVKTDKINVKETTVPALEGGAKSLKENAEFGEQAANTTVKPEEVT